MDKRTASFLARNKDRFGSPDGLPAEFHRRAFFGLARAGKRAAFATPQGSISSGRIVMCFSTHAVLNLGGTHGRAGVMTPENCVYVAGATP